MPTVLRVGPYRYFFYAGDRDEPPHIHVEREEKIAKFWLEPTIALAEYHRLKPKVLKKLDALVREHEDEIRAEWDKHFG